MCVENGYPQHNGTEMLYKVVLTPHNIHHHMHIHGWKSAHVWNVNSKSNTVMPGVYIHLPISLKQRRLTWPILFSHGKVKVGQSWNSTSSIGTLSDWNPFPIYRRYIVFFAVCCKQRTENEVSSKCSNMLPLRYTWFLCGHFGYAADSRRFYYKTAHIRNLENLLPCKSSKT